ncbi:MAG: PhaM family polyhydroxyalkanoate granule multifunctional regulatory protein [Noviherbaspirillum sp.]
MADSNMAGIPGVGAMTDTLDFVKNLWGGMKIPGMAMPSLSVDDVNKQITDLKAVESWLNVNMSMLRSTIQALEVQSATLAALHTMSSSMNSLAQASMPQAAANATQAAAAPAAPSFSFTPPVAEKPAAPDADAAGSASPQAGADLSGATAFANPAAWWNLLQDQFKQAVNTAVAGEAAEPQKAQAAASKPRVRKPAAKKSAPKSQGG